MLQKGDDIYGIDRSILTVEVQLALRREGTDGGEMIARPPLAYDGRVPYGRIGAHNAGQRIEARLVYKEAGLPLCVGPLLMAAQVSSRH